MTNHKYLHGEPAEVNEGAFGYHDEEGVLVDDTEALKPGTRAYNEQTRFAPPQTREERLFEEASWAARSGPCVVIRRGGGAA